MILASLTTLPQNQQKLKFLYLTLPEDINLRSSERHFAPLSKDLLALFNSTEETLVRKLKPSELLDTFLKSLTYSQAEILLKFLLMLLSMLAQEKILPELEQEVLSESKLLMSLP